MPPKTPDLSGSALWQKINEQLTKLFPHLSPDPLLSADFIELRLKSRPDGTILAILKRYGADGGPMVLFGVGYDASLALMALNQSSQGDNWRVDTPWSPSGK